MSPYDTCLLKHQYKGHQKHAAKKFKTLRQVWHIVVMIVITRRTLSPKQWDVDVANLNPAHINLYIGLFETIYVNMKKIISRMNLEEKLNL